MRKITPKKPPIIRLQAGRRYQDAAGRTYIAEKVPEDVLKFYTGGVTWKLVEIHGHTQTLLLGLWADREGRVLGCADRHIVRVLPKEK